MNRAARWLIHSCSFFLPDPTSLSLLPSHYYNSDYQTSPKASDELNWIMHYIVIFFVLEGGFYGGKPPPPKKKKQRFKCYDQPGAFSPWLDLVGFQWCHLQRRTFPCNGAEPDDLGSLEWMEWAPTFNEASLRSPLY